MLRDIEGGLELSATLSLQIANELLRLPPDQEPLHAANFPAHRAALRAQLARWFILRSGGRELTARSLALTLTDAVEIEVLLEYPARPAATVEVTASYVQQLTEGFYCLLRQADAAGQPRARALLVRDQLQATFDFGPLPTPPSVPAAP